MRTRWIGSGLGKDESSLFSRKRWYRSRFSCGIVSHPLSLVVKKKSWTSNISSYSTNYICAYFFTFSFPSSDELISAPHSWTSNFQSCSSPNDHSTACSNLERQSKSPLSLWHFAHSPCFSTVCASEFRSTCTRLPFRPKDAFSCHLEEYSQ